jgi:hypothetical protein
MAIKCGVEPATEPRGISASVVRPVRRNFLAESRRDVIFCNGANHILRIVCEHRQLWPGPV